MLSTYKVFQNEAVKDKFNSYPTDIKHKLLFLRELIFKVAADTASVGPLEETLKWHEPSYLPTQTKSGTTVRIDWKKLAPDHYAMYFNCKTTLVDSFKEIYGDSLRYGGNRSLIFHKEDKIPVKALSGCIAMALTYYLTKKRR